ncbi:syndecan-2 isoform X2 [Archocentrus centrarchus]|uniref:Syndecan n=1 Tax=Amphilophus citrinellus TaxID=61819 RepID=A0A3Q0S406_AMPCI|nr:syndecan-2-A-like isoform X2 [Archocentrus centrarchus]
MRNVWIILTLGLAVFLSGERIAQAAKTSSQADDLYLDDTGSGGYYPEDDDDFNSGSGSGGGEEVVEETATVTMVYIEPSVAQPTQDSTKDFTPRMDTATVRVKPRQNTPRKPFTTKASVPDTEGMQRTSTTSAPGSPPDPVEVHTENLFQRTEVLAAVIAGGVIGFLFAIFLILLLVYRMRKKDEGSYDLGERKPSGAAYQKAPTKEFYA